MKKIITLLVLALVSNYLQAQTLVGAGQTYPTLKSAFDDINNGTLTGNIELQITSSITESALATLNASGSGFASYNSVLIYPTGSGYTISSITNTGGLIVLNGADKVVIDGRVNMSGSVADLTLSYNNANPGSTVIFQNAARFNRIKYCNINVYSTNAANGAVKFAGNVDTSGASSRNKIDYNNLSYINPIGGTQLVLMLVNENSDTISNNNFINFMFKYTLPLNGNAAGIRMINGAFNNLVQENSFYSTGNFQPLQSTNICAIYSQGPVNPAFLPNHILGNYVGGTAPMCGGTPMTLTSVNVADKISLIGIFNQGGTLPNEVANNTISNISFVDNKMDAISFYGLYHYSGYSNIHHNTIGAATGNGSISIHNSNNTNENYGIFMSGNSFPYIHHNIIGSITCTNTSPIYYSSFTAIYKHDLVGYIVVENNVIGSEVTAASIQTNSTADSWQTLKGIHIANADSTLIFDNTISNLYNNCTKTDNANEGGTVGIHTGFTVNARIKGNIIKNLSCNSASLGTITGPVTGIYNSAGGGGNLFQEINGNQIFNLTATNASAANILVKGISINFNFGMPGNYKISNNLIHSLTTNATGSLSMTEGVSVTSGHISLINNIISLGTTNRRAYGVHQYQSAVSSTVDLFHNTVYIGGSPSDFESAAYRKANNAATGIFKNNIFFNNKANASGVQLRHFAIITLSSFNNNSINYNNYFAPNTGGAIGRFLGTDIETLAAWQISTTQDANSIQIDPAFAMAGGTQAVDYFPGTPMPAVAIVGINTDLLLNNRTLFWMGALESNVPLPLTLKTFTAYLQANNSVEIRWSTSSELNSSHFEIEKSVDADHWNTIGQIQAAGNSQVENRYQLLDNEAFEGVMYYRIKQVDLDGQYTYSSVEKVLKSVNNEITIYPNPCNMTLNISKPSSSQPSIIEIYSMDGRRVLSEQINETNHRISVNTLAKGTYMLRVFDNEKTFTTKFVRQ